MKTPFSKRDPNRSLIYNLRSFVRTPHGPRIKSGVTVEVELGRET